MTPEDKVLENRCRRMASRQNARLHRSRRRDTLADDYGTYVLVWLGKGQADEFSSLLSVCHWLENEEGPWPGKSHPTPKTTSNDSLHVTTTTSG